MKLNNNILEQENIVMYDVDGTLIRPVENYAREVDEISPDLWHINLLKNHHRRGFFIIVWSHSGWKWAKDVVE
jgi:histidinol phosphatase-like enzyme